MPSNESPAANVGPQDIYPPWTRTRWPIHTKLGKLLIERGKRPKDLSMGTGVHHRQITEYLAGRRPPTHHSLPLLCAYFEVDAADIVEDYYPFLGELETDVIVKHPADPNLILSQRREDGGRPGTPGMTTGVQLTPVVEVPHFTLKAPKLKARAP
jgi:transcriptional regulator with XRE-family HTH domain